LYAKIHAKVDIEWTLFPSETIYQKAPIHAQAQASILNILKSFTTANAEMPPSAIFLPQNFGDVFISGKQHNQQFHDILQFQPITLLLPLR
jgi:hypothetical protein